MTQEFLRDDLLQLSHRLDADNFNIKAYRKRNTAHSQRKNQKLLQSTDFMLSDCVEDLGIDKFNQNTQRTTDIISATRISSTSGVKRRSNLSDYNHLSFTKTARTNRNTAIQSMGDIQEKQEKVVSQLQETKEKVSRRFSRDQRQYAQKGKLKNKHLQNWLNQVLLQYCKDETFDSTIENSALKKYGIDKNSLLSKGINPQNLDRIFKSLFVYSMGFNTLLKEVGGKNINIRKTFWKVYAILLEYCSDGDFETMIGQIERDKVRKMQLMKNQIEKRQQIIENNEEIHQEKNAKIFKELKQLREVNSNLENDKNVLMEDYKQAEQAFNQQVSLRLKFQNKINQIHGVHRQLGIKHQKLYDDLQLKISQQNTIAQKISKTNENYILLKSDYEAIRKENLSLKEESKFNEQQVEELKRKSFTFQIKEVEWRHKKEQLNASIQQRERKAEQLLNQIKNLQLMVTLREQSEKQLQKQYKRALDENKGLINSMQSQQQSLGKYMMQKKEFNDRDSKLYAEISVINRKLNQTQLQLQKKKKEVNQLRINMGEKDIEVQTMESKNKHLVNSLNDCFLKMEEMKKIKSNFQEEVFELKNKTQIYQAYYLEKQKIINQLNQKIDDLERKVSEFNITRKTLESRVNVLNQKLLTEEQINKKKIQKFQIEIKSMEKQFVQLKEEAQIKRNQAIKFSNLFEETFNKLKDQMFQRNDLELRYNQSLSVVESETGHIKQLNIKMSELQQNNQQFNRKIKGLEFVMEGKDKASKLQIGHLNTTVKQLKQQLKQKNNFINPMVYEDLVSKYIQATENIVKLKQEMQENSRQSHNKQHLFKIDMLNKEIINSRASFENQIEKLKVEIQNQKGISNSLRQKVMRLEQSNDTSNNREDAGNFKERQRKYLQFIKEKSLRIEDLLKEVQKMQDYRSQMIKQIQQNKIQLQQKQQTIQFLTKEKNIIQKDKEIIENQKLCLAKERQRLANRAIQLEQKNTINHSHNSDPLVADVQPYESKLKIKQKNYQNREQNIQKTTKPGWRTDFSAKMKNACNYYKK